jgi:predicted house-cleaning noncanonical NTP pyrophosphatase (MazG superfamily)
MFKLIRDNIPELMTANGSVCNYAAVQDEEFFKTLLRAKLTEETNEYLASRDSLEELADIKLVIDYMIGDRMEDFQRIYDQKLTEYGGFDKRFIGFFADQPASPTEEKNN